jgi:hypothetical protein
VEFKFPPKGELISIIQDLTRPLPQRMRSIFYLRTLGGEDSVEALCAGAFVSSAALPGASFFCRRFLGTCCLPRAVCRDESRRAGPAASRAQRRSAKDVPPLHFP